MKNSFVVNSFDNNTNNTFYDLLVKFFPTCVKRFLAIEMSSCSPGAQILSPTGNKRFRVATIRLVCMEYRSPFLFIFFLSWSETIPWDKIQQQKTWNADKYKLSNGILIPFAPIQSICPYLWHLTLCVCDEERHIVDLILDYKILFFSLKIL